jgi:uncharacterized phage protein gp47/JayE
MVGEYLEKYTYAYILAQALSQVPNTLDKREGSIIYDAIAPACYALAGIYMELRQMAQQTYIISANGSYLDLRVQEQGITRYAATYAIKKATFKNSNSEAISVPIGSRFSTIVDSNTVNYAVTDMYKDEFGDTVPGTYQLTCETLGTIGNSYTGNLLPISYISGLASAVMSDIIVPARDLEADEDLRQRYIDKVNSRPFGGNIAQYREMFLGIDGIGDCQIYPVWNGGGTVKVSIIDSNYQPATTEFISIVQDLVDPDSTPELQGTGIGMAPIDHKVTITTPNVVTCDIESTVTLLQGYTLPQVEPLIRSALGNYLNILRGTWGNATQLNEYSLAVYVSQVVAAIIGASGVANATNTTVNGSSSDLILNENSTTQEIPILGEVVIHLAT